MAGRALPADDKDNYTSPDTPHLPTNHTYPITTWAPITNTTHNQTTLTQNR